MHILASQPVTDFKSTYLVPVFEQSKKHSLLISSIAINILLVAFCCHRSTLVLDFAKKNIKVVTIIFPLIYSIPLPFLVAAFLLPGAPMEILSFYFLGLNKIWKVWLNYIKN